MNWHHAHPPTGNTAPRPTSNSTHAHSKFHPGLMGFSEAHSPLPQFKSKSQSQQTHAHRIRPKHSLPSPSPSIQSLGLSREHLGHVQSLVYTNPTLFPVWKFVYGNLTRPPRMRLSESETWHAGREEESKYLLRCLLSLILLLMTLRVSVCLYPGHPRPSPIDPTRRHGVSASCFAWVSELPAQRVGWMERRVRLVEGLRMSSWNSK